MPLVESLPWAERAGALAVPSGQLLTAEWQALREGGLRRHLPAAPDQVFAHTVKLLPPGQEGVGVRTERGSVR